MGFEGTQAVKGEQVNRKLGPALTGESDGEVVPGRRPTGVSGAARGGGLGDSFPQEPEGPRRAVVRKEGSGGDGPQGTKDGGGGGGTVGRNMPASKKGVREGSRGHSESVEGARAMSRENPVTVVGARDGVRESPEGVPPGGSRGDRGRMSPVLSPSGGDDEGVRRSARLKEKSLRRSEGDELLYPLRCGSTAGRSAGGRVDKKPDVHHNSKGVSSSQRSIPIPSVAVRPSLTFLDAAKVRPTTGEDTAAALDQPVLGVCDTDLGPIPSFEDFLGPMGTGEEVGAVAEQGAIGVPGPDVPESMGQAEVPEPASDEGGMESPEDVQGGAPDEVSRGGLLDTLKVLMAGLDMSEKRALLGSLLSLLCPSGSPRVRMGPRGRRHCRPR